MAENAKKPEPGAAADGKPVADADGADQIDQGAYEVLRRRLQTQGQELRKRVEKLNEARKQVFGTIPTKLLASESIGSEHNCIPQDIAYVAGRFIFGYNVQFGLKTEIDVADVFSIHRLIDGHFAADSLELLSDPQFLRDFKELYRYYKNAHFSQLYFQGPNLYMKFQVGKTADDFKAFKWLVSKEGIKYIDGRSDHEIKTPAQEEIRWTRATRDAHRPGTHPHISVLDQVFVETIGGDLTIKVEDNTQSGKGIYSEPVENSDQTLDDAEIHYARLGTLILLKVRPFKERDYRYFVFHPKSQKVIRCDGIGGACVLLPEDHGLIYSSGYVLTSGKQHGFPDGPTGMVFERRIASPNGEDTLFVFYAPESATYALLSYNLIEMSVSPPILCNGYSLYDSGGLAFFRRDTEPRKHHPIQLWQTPFVGDDFRPERKQDSYLFKIGNKDIVRGMSECVALLELIDRQEVYPGLYVDIVRAASELTDGYHWLSHAECFDLAEPIKGIRDTANATVSEFERVVQIRQATAKQYDTVSTAAQTVLMENYGRLYENITGYVQGLANLREVRGEVIGLRELRYVDRAAVDALEQKIADQGDELGQRAADFLLKPESLDPYRKGAQEHSGLIDKVVTVLDAKALSKEIQKSADDLEMLIQVVSNLKIDDANQRTQIIEGISAVFSQVNGSRSRLRARIQELGRKEGAAEFASQIKLLDQSVANYIDLADAPDKAQDFLTKVMVQLEELEGRFAEFDEFVTRLTDKREEVYNAFESRRLTLVEQRGRRANNLGGAADRILKGVRSRIDSFKSVAEINGFFASDLMVQKVRDLIDELRAMEEPVKADDIQSKLKTAREESVRQLKDKQELFVDGQNVIRLGRHNFSVNTQPIDVTLLPRENGPALHVGGTQFFEPVKDAELESLKDVWELQTPAESASVYRGEYLASLAVAQIRAETEKAHAGAPMVNDERLMSVIHQIMSERLDEGYTKGVSDVDALRIGRVLLEMESTLGLLKYPSKTRALATLFWSTWADDIEKPSLASRMRGLGRAARAFHTGFLDDGTVGTLARRIAAFAEESALFDPALAADAARYLFDEATAETPGVTSSPEAAKLRDGFRHHLQLAHHAVQWVQTLETLRDRPVDRFRQARAWVLAYTQSVKSDAALVETFLDEAAVLVFLEHRESERVVNAATQAKVQGLVGAHSRISGGVMEIDYHAYRDRLSRHMTQTVPRYRKLQEIKARVLAEARKRMKIDELQASVLTSFVRNKLIDEVFLPLIGDNLAKQLGTVGETTRTDRMGMLLLISPPGYGKTTLMEYVANRLGVVFVKVNGPALGHNVTSLDPAEATNAAARQELEKIGLALEMGDNVILYVDDIQHCHPEFLQKFISLCDATRKIEGVYRGVTRTYNLRGRKFAVVMAGNPYTESGARFQIPDMLANRSDTYNLGDILGDHGEAFKLSYLENCVGANPVLNPLASRSRNDVHGVIKMAQNGTTEGVTLESSIPEAQLQEMIQVMAKLLKIRDIILRVNQEYIHAAAQEDQFRTEPRFQLQGSYRNMNRIAERVVAVMNDRELEMSVFSAYEQDAQTLTSGAEANLLRFREITGTINEEQKARWMEIKRTFQRNNQVKALGGEEKTAQVLVLLSAMSQAMNDVRDAINKAAAERAKAHEQERALAQEQARTQAQLFAQARVEAQPQAHALSAAAVEIDLTPIAEKLEALTGVMQTLPELLGPAVAQLGQMSQMNQAGQQGQANQPSEADRVAVQYEQTRLAAQSQANSEAQTRVLEGIRDVLATRPQTAEPSSSEPAALSLEPAAQSLIQELVQQMAQLARSMADNQQAMTQAASQRPAQERADADISDMDLERDPAQDARRAKQTAKSVRDSIRSLPARDKNVEVITARHDMAPIEVRIVNKVPATFLYLLRAQFELMRGWLDPLTKVNQHQDEQLYEIRKSLELMTQRYEKIITGLDAQHQSEEDKPH